MCALSCSILSSSAHYRAASSQSSAHVHTIVQHPVNPLHLSTLLCSFTQSSASRKRSTSHLSISRSITQSLTLLFFHHHFCHRPPNNYFRMRNHRNNIVHSTCQFPVYSNHYYFLKGEKINWYDEKHALRALLPLVEKCTTTNPPLSLTFANRYHVKLPGFKPLTCTNVGNGTSIIVKMKNHVNQSCSWTIVCETVEYSVTWWT